MIFERNRKGRNIHDLVWVLFRLHNPKALKLIAERLKSNVKADAILSRSLLNIDSVNKSGLYDSSKQYSDYLNRLNDNDRYLYFTDESYNFSTEPRFSAVDLERKYLNKGTQAYDYTPISALDKAQSNTMEAFNKLSGAEKQLLSEYSSKTYRSNASEWSNWLKRPVQEQLKEAKLREGRL
jgi:hypothetical protein